MKLSKKNVSIVLILVVGAMVLVFTPLRSRMRGLVAGFMSQTKVALKEDKIVPEKAYTWSIVDRQGKLLEYQALKGEVVVINFWATWCGPCVAEMPSLQKLYDLYGDKVRFLFVTDDKVEKVDTFMNKGYTIPVYYTKTAIPEIFYSKTIPTTYIINKEGRIVIAKTDAHDWASNEIVMVLERLLEE